MSTSAELSGAEIAPFIVIVVVTFLGIYFFYWLFSNSLFIVRHAEVMIVERWGKYHTTLKPGLHWLWPVMDSPRQVKWRYMDVLNNNATAQIVTVHTNHVDMREHLIDFGKQHVITHDTVEMYIDALVYFRITDPRLAVLEVANLPDAVELLTQATLRNIIASMTLDDTFSSREKLNQELLYKMRPDAERWGVVITRVEIFDIQPGEEVKTAMESQIKAERKRRAMVLSADGKRQAEIIASRGLAAARVYEAVGDAAKFVNEATGEAEANVFTAEAEAAEITLIKDKVGDECRAVDYISAIQWLKTLEGMSKNGADNHVILLPVETIDGINDIMKATKIE
jgi:regulator of protease activity HflC (stomatin/prohibitin superfamily)